MFEIIQWLYNVVDYLTFPLMVLSRPDNELFIGNKRIFLIDKIVITIISNTRICTSLYVDIFLV